MPDNIQIFGQVEGEPIETDERAPVRVTSEGALIAKLDPSSENQVLVAAENGNGIATPLQIDANGRLKVEAGFAGNIVVDNIEFGNSLAPTDNMTGVQGPIVVAALITNHEGHWDTVKSDKNHGVHVKVANDITIDNFPASQEIYGTVSISGSVTVTDGGGPLSVDGNVNATQVGEWNINTISYISNPVEIYDGDQSITVDGTIDIGNLPAIQTVDGTVTIGNASIPVTDNGGSLTVDGSVSVSNFPATQTISGTVTVGNNNIVVTDGGGSITVDGSVGIAGTVSVSDGGASLTVDGSVSVANFPSTYPITDNGGSITVDGSVSISNSSIAVTDNGGSLTIDGTVTPSNVVADGAASSGSDRITPVGGIDGSGNWQAIKLDSNGKIELAGALTIDETSGPLTVDGTVNVGNFPATQAVSGTVSIGNASIPVTDNGGSLTVDGSVSVSNFPATQPVSGTVTVGNASIPVTDNGGSLTVDGSVGITGTVAVTDNSGSLTVDGTVDIGNWPVSLPVTDGGGSLTVDGTIAISNASIPVTDNGGSLTVDGTVNAVQSGNWTVDVNFPASIDVADGGGSLTVDGTISVGNFPATQVVSGTVTIGNSPLPITDNNSSLTVDGTIAVSSVAGTVAVTDNGGTLSIDDGSGSITIDGTVTALQSGTWDIGTLTTVVNPIKITDNDGSITVDGSVSVSNFPATQAVSGTITVGNASIPITDNGGSITVDGSVSISNLPVVQPVSDNNSSLTVDGTVTVQDGGGSITIDGSVAVSAVSGNVTIVDGGGSITVDGTVTPSNVVADGATSSGSDRVTPVAGIDGSGNWQAIKVDADGKIELSGTITVGDGSGPLTVDGTVSVGNFPATQAVSGSVAITNASIPVTDNGGSLTVDGSVSVTNFPASYPVTDNGGSLTIDGTVTPSNVVADGAASGGGDRITPIGGLDGSSNWQAIAVDTDGKIILSGTQTVSGSVSVSNFPATQPVSGTVAVSNTSFPVTDNGGSLTVDGTVAATQSGTWSVRTQDGSGNSLTSASRGSERALSVQVIDGSGTQITTFGGPQYIEDTASSGAESLTMAGSIREDSPSTSTSADGDYATLKTDSVGRLWVNASGAPIPIIDNGGSITVDGTIAATQSGTWNIGSVTSITNAVAVTDNNGTLSIDDGSGSITVDGTIAATQSGTWNIGSVTSITNAVAITDNNSTISIDDGSGSITVDGTIAATQSGNWSIRAQDGSGNSLTSSARGSERALSVQIVDASGNQITTFGGGIVYTEDTASGGAESLTLMGAVRQDTPSATTSASGDYANLKTDSVGRLWVHGTVFDVNRIAYSFTRPADTTAYTAGDAISNSTSAPTIISFANASTATGTGGIITGITISKSTAATGGARFRLYLYSTSVTAVNDNTAFAQTFANTEYMVAVQDFTLISTGTNTAFATENGLYIPYQCVATTLYAHLAVIENYTPGNAEQFRIVLHTIRDN